jgi:hypothetical protein
METFTNNDGEFSVADLYDRVNTPPVEILISDLEHSDADEPWGSREFHTRAMAADLSYPILVYKDPDNLLWVADGMHRIYKALWTGKLTIQGHILEEL